MERFDARFAVGMIKVSLENTESEARRNLYKASMILMPTVMFI